MIDNIEKDLKSSAGDVLYGSAKAGLSFIPFIGGAISELFSLIISPPLEQRRNDWLLNIYTSLNEIKNKVDEFDLENLSQNELFITVMMQSTQIALKNHQAEKLVALHNAVINTALNINIEEIEQLIFLNYINDLSVWHIKILHFLQNPRQRFVENDLQLPNLYMGSPSHILVEYYPELADKNSFVNMIIRDLFNDALITSESINGMMTEQGIYAGRTTEFGNRFIKYISEQIL